jgi:hypothetical protein
VNDLKNKKYVNFKKNSDYLSEIIIARNQLKKNLTYTHEQVKLMIESKFGFKATALLKTKGEK